MRSNISARFTLALTGIFWMSHPVLAKKEPDIGPQTCAIKKVPILSRSKTYSQVPFKAGEESKYELYYGPAKAGYGFMRVGSPIKYSIITGFDKNNKPLKKSIWHMVFSGHSYTGDWYSGIFRGNYKTQAYSRPWDFGISKFYLEEKTSTLMSETHKKKHLDFHQGLCQVKTNEEDFIKNKKKKGKFTLSYGAIDALGAFFKLRTLNYDKGPVRFTVYSSEKNWILEAIPTGKEKIEVPAGTFESDKLKMKTFLGDKLEQRGQMTVWVARKPPRPLVKIEGEFKFGNLNLELAAYKPGS